MRRTKIYTVTRDSQGPRGDKGNKGDSGSSGGSCGGCIITILLLWALWFGLPWPGNKLYNIDIFPPRIWDMNEVESNK